MVLVETSEVLQFREVPLAQDLIDGDGGGVGKVQAPQPRPHGQAQAALRVLEEQFLRQSGILPAKDQPGGVRVGRLGVGPLGLGGEEEQLDRKSVV